MWWENLLKLNEYWVWSIVAIFVAIVIWIWWSYRLYNMINKKIINKVINKWKGIVVTNQWDWNNISVK